MSPVTKKDPRPQSASLRGHFKPNVFLIFTMMLDYIQPYIYTLDVQDLIL